MVNIIPEHVPHLLFLWISRFIYICSCKYILMYSWMCFSLWTLCIHAVQTFYLHYRTCHMTTCLPYLNALNNFPIWIIKVSLSIYLSWHVWTLGLQRDTEAVSRLQGETETWGVQRSLTQAAAGPEMGGHNGLSAVIAAAVTLHTHIIPDDISVMNSVRLPCPFPPLDVVHFP